MENIEILEQLIGSANMCIFSKDKHGNYLFANENFAQAAGLDSTEAIVGKSDFDLIWKSQADHFRKSDLSAMNGNTFVCQHESQIQVDGIKEITVTKIALRTPSGRVEGVVGAFIENTGYMFSKKEGMYNPTQNTIELSKQYENEKITQREAHVFYLVLSGFSSSMIATELDISKGTVRFHIDNLKHKLQCKSQGDLIQTAIRSGLSLTIFNCFSEFGVWAG